MTKRILEIFSLYMIYLFYGFYLMVNRQIKYMHPCTEIRISIKEKVYFECAFTDAKDSIQRILVRE